MSGRVLLAVAAAAVALAAATTAIGAATPELSVRNDRARVDATLGERFTFTSTVTNGSATATVPLVAHLNIVGLDPSVYVDPEDWSSERTVFIGSLASGGSRVVHIEMQAVTHGSLAAYVAVLPESRPAAPPLTSPALQLEVAHRTTIAAGGMLPLAIVVPGVLGLALLVTRVSRRRAVTAS